MYLAKESTSFCQPYKLMIKEIKQFHIPCRTMMYRNNMYQYHSISKICKLTNHWLLAPEDFTGVSSGFFVAHPHSHRNLFDTSASGLNTCQQWVVDSGCWCHFHIFPHLYGQLRAWTDISNEKRSFVEVPRLHERIWFILNTLESEHHVQTVGGIGSG